MFITEVRMIKLWRFLSVPIVLAVCLGLLLVPGAIPQALADPGNEWAFEIQDETVTKVPVSTSFTVNITAVQLVAIQSDGWEAYLSYDPTYLSVTSIDIPATLPPPNNGTPDKYPVPGIYGMANPGYNNTEGILYAGYSPAPGSPKLNATFVFATIHFDAKAVGGITYLNFTDPDAFHTTKILLGATELQKWSSFVNGTVMIGSPELTVDVSPAGTGDVNISGVIPSSYPNVTVWNWSDVVDLEAVEKVAGWTFHHWSGDLTGNTNPDTITIDADKSVVAHFARYNLTVSSTSGGTVTDPGEGTFRYPEDEIVSLQATSDTGYHFVNWTGGVGTIDDDTAASTTINMSGDYSIVANFAINQYNLTINSTTCGNVTTPSEGVRGPYNHSTVVNLIATPDTNCTFVNWTGNVGTIDDVNSANTNITMNENYSITANFALEQYDLTINSTIGGTVTTPSEGVHTYDHGTVVNLTATPDANYTFVNWTGGVVTIDDVNSATTNITMYGNYSITANFVLKQYNLTINSTIGGTVTTPGEGVKGPYIHGTVVNLIAEPDADYAFLEWSGNVSEIDDVNSSTTNITMYDNYSIWAHFGPHEFDATPRSLTFTTVEGENPPSQTLEICNTGNGTLDWSLSDNKGWLKESPTSGSLAEEGCEDVKVSVDVAGMKAGDYRATITFTGSLDLEVPVSLHIESAMMEIPGGPAGLSASALSISPQQVQPGQDVTISINVANTGGATGSYNAVLYINSVVEDSQTVSVAAGASKNVIFTVSKTQAGVYDVSLAGQSGQFEVVGGGGWFGGGGLGTGGIIAIVVVVIILVVAVIFILRGTARPE